MRRGRLLGSLALTLLVVTFAGSAAVAPANAQSLSRGCESLNESWADSSGERGLYGAATTGAAFEFAAGEQVTVSAARPTTFGPPTTITLKIDEAIVDTAAFPGTVDYTFPAAGTHTVTWSVDLGNVFWTVRCGLAPRAEVPVDFVLSGDTALLPDGDVIAFDQQGHGHRLIPSYPGLGPQLVHYAGWRMTLFGTLVNSEPPLSPNNPILVRDFLLEPGGTFDGSYDTVTDGETERLPDGDVIIRDRFGRGHRLRADGAIKAHLQETAGTRLTVAGFASITNTGSRLNWPIDVLSVLHVHLDKTGCFDPIFPPLNVGACIHVSGFGLEPGSSVDLIVDGLLLVHETVNPDGSVFITDGVGCFPLDEPAKQLTVRAVGRTPLSMIEATDTMTICGLQSPASVGT